MQDTMNKIKLKTTAILGLFLFISITGFSQSEQINNPVKNFEKLWKVFDNRYAFFELKNVDWNDMYQKYRPMINYNTTNDNLFSVCCSMISELNDRHVSLSDKKNKKKCNAGVPIRLLEEFPNNNALKMLVNTIDSTLIVNHFADLTQTKMKIPYLFGDVVEYTDNGKYGYLRINLMFGLSKKKLGQVLDNCIESFQDVQGIIIDVRFNSGGYDKYSFEIAGRFVDKKWLGHFKSKKKKSGFTELEPRYLEPKGNKQLTMPIVLLTSDQSMSATDVFALIMKELPYVTIIGDNTHGVFSDIKDFKLPNGWKYTFSSQKFLSADKHNYEGVGISPDIKILNTKNDVNKGIDPLLVEAIKVLDAFL